MSKTVDYFFSLISPYAYLGHAELLRIARTAGANVHYRPVPLGKLFPESGGLPLAQRHPLRRAYRVIELQRWREKRNVPLVLHPRHWPFNVELADKLVIAVNRAHPELVDAFVALAFRGVWVEEQNLADEDCLQEILKSAGIDDDALMAAARDTETANVYAANLSDALSIGVFGSPCYVIDGEVFWGQDRLEMVAEMLASGRAPFTPEA